MESEPKRVMCARPGIDPRKPLVYELPWEYMDPTVKHYYNQYLHRADPNKSLLKLEQMNHNRFVFTHAALFLVDSYGSDFAFSSMFIGTKGSYINQIKELCPSLSISVEIAAGILHVAVFSSSSVSDFLLGVRLTQNRLVEVLEIFSRERAHQAPKLMFVQPFYPPDQRQHMHAYFAGMDRAF